LGSSVLLLASSLLFGGGCSDIFCLCCVLQC
jgi:hypothetical protein